MMWNSEERNRMKIFEDFKAPPPINRFTKNVKTGLNKTKCKTFPKQLKIQNDSKTKRTKRKIEKNVDL